MGIIRYKKTRIDGHINAISEDGLQTTFTKNHKEMWKAYKKFDDGGGVTEPIQTTEEKTTSLMSLLRKKRNVLLKEADKLELPTVLKRHNITIEQVEDYKQILCDMPSTHNTIEQLENPEWPEKLTTQKLL